MVQASLRLSCRAKVLLSTSVVSQLSRVGHPRRSVQGARPDSAARTSDGGEVNRGHFDSICPAEAEGFTCNDEMGFPNHPAYQYWFLVDSAGTPCAALKTDGQLWDDRGEWWDVASLYGEHHQIGPAMHTVLGHLLP